MMETIKTLRKIFATSVLAFEVAMVWSEETEKSDMHKLHELCLEELNKDEPDMHLVHDLIFGMEKLAEVMTSKAPPYKPGGKHCE